MKKLRFYSVILLLTFLAVSMLQSCLSDADDTSNGTLFTIGTIKVIEDKEYYFNLDDGEKMYPSDTTYIHNYTVNDDQRVFIHFLPLEESIPGYKYNVKLIQIEDILTKDIIPLTEETADSIGNDRINVVELWITGNYLNIEHQFFHNNNSSKKHMLNLVINQTKQASASEDDYLTLEFRHNAYDDEPRTLGWGVVSFRLKEIANQLVGKKGLKIIVNTIYDGKQTYTVDLKNKTFIGLKPTGSFFLHILNTMG